MRSPFSSGVVVVVVVGTRSTLMLHLVLYDVPVSQEACTARPTLQPQHATQTCCSTSSISQIPRLRLSWSLAAGRWQQVRVVGVEGQLGCGARMHYEYLRNYRCALVIHALSALASTPLLVHPTHSFPSSSHLSSRDGTGHRRRLDTHSPGRFLVVLVVCATTQNLSRWSLHDHIPAYWE